MARPVKRVRESFMDGGSTAPSAPPFYSALMKAVDATDAFAAVPGAQWRTYLASRPGIKADELKWTGLDVFLSERARRKVTKQEVADFLAENHVTVKEVMLGANH